MRCAFARVGLIVLQALVVSGCVMVGPEYEEPSAPVATDWIEIEGSQTTSESPVGPKWWETAFNDPELDRLVDSALQQNLSLRSAALRVLQSQQQLAIAVGNRFPQQQEIAGRAARQKSGGTTFNNYNLGFNVGWEADFWGRFSRQVEAASAELDASVASYDGALVSLVSQVAQNYILIRTLQERIVVAEFNIGLQTESVRVSTAKFDAGEVSTLDMDQAESLLNNSKASLLALEVSLQQAKNSLAILLGEPPQTFSHLLDDRTGIPSVRPDIALGMPQDIIRRRPDIRVAERQLAAQSAEIGFAITELYPQLSLGGSVGTSAEDSGDLFSSDSETWAVSGGFNWNIFNYGRLKSNVRLQDALFQQLLADYRDTVLQAQGDVENAIVAYVKSHQQLAAYKLAAAASQRAVAVSTAQYRDGLIDFNRVLSTLGADAQQRDLLATAQGDVTSNLVRVYTELGGGWEIRENRDPVDLLPDATKDEMRERTGAWRGVLE